VRGRRECLFTLYEFPRELRAALAVVHTRRLFFVLPMAKDELPPSSPLPLPSPLLPLSVGPLNIARGWGHCKLPQCRQTIWCILESNSATLVAVVFVDFPKNKCNLLHKTSLISYGGPIPRRAAPYEEFFSWGSRHHCPMAVGAYAVEIELNTKALATSVIPTKTDRGASWLWTQLGQTGDPDPIGGRGNFGGRSHCARICLPCSVNDALKLVIKRYM